MPQNMISNIAYSLSPRILLVLLTLSLSMTAQTPTQLLFPFRLSYDPMDRLLLINFEKDPDSTYIGFEPQVFNDPQNGQGHLVIGWRRDGYVDVYQQEGLTLSPDRYTIAGKGLAETSITTFDTAHFVVSEQGVTAQYAFKDKLGRSVEIRIQESHTSRRKPFSLLAPLGHSAEDPSALPLVFLYEFYFVRKKHTTFNVHIDGRMHKPDGMPLPLDGHRVYFTRYSPRPLIASLNPAFEGILAPVSVNPGDTVIFCENQRLHLEPNQKHPAVRRLDLVQSVAPLFISFDPPYPDLATLPGTCQIEGRFTIGTTPEAGTVSGNYQINRNGNRILLSLEPTGGWSPRPDRFSLRFLYTIARPFKNWPKTYRWKAGISLTDGVADMVSGWKRK